MGINKNGDISSSSTIGFRRYLLLPWLDAAASLALETSDLGEVRQRLTEVVATNLTGTDSRRVSVDILINIWFKSAAQFQVFHATAMDLYRTSNLPTDRLWLHYGMSLLVYPFFRSCCAAIGHLSRNQDLVTRSEVKQILIAERGALGGMNRAVERIMFSLGAWEILVEAETPNAYSPRRRFLSASSREYETWMLAIGLATHRGDEIPFADLLRRTEFFPLAFTISLDEVRRHPWFAVNRQGASIDMVGLTPVVYTDR